MRTRRIAFPLLLLTLSACAPSLAPLYRDYEVEQPSASIQPLLEGALQEAGWTLEEAPAANIVRTQPRTLSRWGLYDVVASLEVAPVGDQHVRLYVHPYREYITGGRSKIPYLKGSIRRAFLPELTEALEARGLKLLGTPIQRDRAAQPES